MKPLPFMIASTTALALLAPLNLLAGERPKTAIGYWNPTKASTDGGVFKVSDDVGGNDLGMDQTTGVSVVTDPEAPENKALLFDGSQDRPASSKKKFDLGENVCFTVKAKPMLDGGDVQSLLFFYKSAELRYMKKSGQLALVVWYQGGAKAMEIRGQLDPGRWSTIEACVQGGALSLTINGDKTGGQLPAGEAMNPIATRLAVGHGANRPYFGALADISVAPQKD